MQCKQSCGKYDHNLLQLQVYKVLYLRFRSTLESLTLFKLPDSALYFLTQMERLLGPSFTPSSEDMIRMRRATTGIQVRLGGKYQTNMNQDDMCYLRAGDGAAVW